MTSIGGTPGSKRIKQKGLMDTWTIKDHVKTGDYFGHWAIMDQENKLPLPFQTAFQTPKSMGREKMGGEDPWDPWT